MKVIANQNETVDALAYRTYGRSAGLVEPILERNPRLVELGPFLPAGTAVDVPEPSQAVATPTRQLVQLWD